ncbi:transposase [Myxosarcina sp. GI1]|uniref:transposase n=1 Tax=Myxosarcina sp. GI1 TaxID=1541065 RepID=UPI0009DE9F78|nr:transposase [Myxosarcina sp. GI1]
MGNTISGKANTFSVIVVFPFKKRIAVEVSSAILPLIYIYLPTFCCNGLTQGGFKSQSYVKVMNWIAQKAASLFEKTGKLTVVVQDNSPIHKSQKVRVCWRNWSEQGLLLFFLPAYCPELNEIETQWHQLKTHEIAGRIFDNEYDLAMTIIQGINRRSEQGDYHLKRFIFNSA